MKNAPLFLIQLLLEKERIYGVDFIQGIPSFTAAVTDTTSLYIRSIDHDLGKLRLIRTQLFNRVARVMLGCATRFQAASLDRLLL